MRIGGQTDTVVATFVAENMQSAVPYMCCDGSKKVAVGAALGHAGVWPGGNVSAAKTLLSDYMP